MSDDYETVRRIARDRMGIDLDARSRYPVISTDRLTAALLEAMAAGRLAQQDKAAAAMRKVPAFGDAPGDFGPPQIGMSDVLDGDA